MKHTSFLLTLATEHTISVYLFAAALGAICIYFLTRVIESRNFRVAGNVAACVGTVLGAIGLRKWLIALGTVVANYHPKKNFFAYTDHYVDASFSYLTSLDVLPWALAFYALVGFATFLSVKFLKAEVESAQIRSFGFAVVALVVTVTTCGATLPILFAGALYQARKPRVTFELIKGKEVIDDNPSKAIAKLKAEVERGELGVRIHPKIRLSKNLETQHILIVGRSGAGKTNTLAPMVEDIHVRGDKVVLYDVKGDFTAAYAYDKRAMIFSPFDKRSRAWNIAKDIRSELDADELGKALFPSEQGRADFFSLGGQNVTKSAILKLIAEKGETWGFKELAELFSSKQYIMQAVKEYLPASAQIWGSEGGKQADGIFGEIRTRLSCFDYFAKAWPQSHIDGVSLSEWVGSTSAPNMILVQGNSKYTFVDQFFTTLIYTYLFKQIQSLSDSHSRRIWTIIDEFSSLPAIPNFGNTMRRARSKGLCMVLAMQDFGGLETKYAEQGGRETLINNTATKAIGSLLAPETAEYISKMLGTNEYLRRVHIPFLKKGETQPQPVPVTKPAVSAGTFGDIKLASKSRAAEFYVITQGAPIVKLKYKVIPLPKISTDFEPAEWMSETPKAVKAAPNDQPKKVTEAINELKREVGELSKSQNTEVGYER